MGGILELIKLIYGSKALSKILGTRTNVIRLPDNELKQYTKNDLNIEAASDKLAQKAKADMKELLADYPRMNDAEKLIFEGNLRRLGNKLGVTEKGPAADVLEFGTGEKVSPEGIMSLTEKAGQKNPPTTLMGNLESRIKQLEASGEDLSKMKGQTYDEFMNDITQGQRTMIKLEDEGLVRATAREIIDKDIKSKKIKLPKEIEADFKQGGGEPIDVFRQFYGEDALEQLNSMVPDFKQMYSSKEAAEAAIKKFKFKFKADRPPGSISIEDAKKAEQEFNIVPADSEEGKVITEKLIGKPKAPVTELVTAEKIILDMKNMDPMDAMKEANKVLKREGKYKNLKEEDVERIMEDTNDFIFGRDIPEDPEDFATGGRVGMVGGGITKLAKKLIKKTKKYKFTGEESLNDLYELERQGKITREDMNVYSPRYLEYLDAQIINKEKLYTPKEWEKTPEVLKNKMRGRIDPDWEEANFGEDFNWDQARSTEMKQQQQLKDFDITGRTKNSKGGRVRMAGGGILKLAMKFFNDNNPVSAYKKYLKYVKETAQKDPAKLAPEMGGIVVGSELIHRGLRRKLKEAKEKNDTDDSEDSRTEKAAGGVSQGLDYLTGIERQGYANGDYVVQAGIKNYLGKQKTATVPIKWKSGKDHPDTELAYITKPEKELLIKLDLHGSMKDGKPNKGPGGIISLNSGGSGNGSSSGDSSGDTGGESSYTDYSDADIGPMGPQAGDSSYTDYSDADMGPVGNYTMFDEATAKANLQSVVDNMKAKMTKDMDPLQRSAFNLSINNPFTSTFGKIGNSVLSPIGTILSSFSYNPDFAGDRKYTDYGNTSSYFTGDESDGGGRDERTPISSFDSALFSPDLAKNRDYRLYQGANNPFYSMQAVPSGGIKNVYTEFKKGGRVGFALGGLNYLTGL
jgi:hypothetical protein